MSIVETRTPPPTPPDPPPPLEQGDRLTREEFERRYQAMPDIKKAELIEGRVYIPSPDFPRTTDGDEAMSSPVSFEHHSAPHFDLITWLGFYRMATPGVAGGDNATVRMDADNEPQPDALLRLEPAAGGNSRVSVEDYIEGAPELIVEIAASSADFDLGPKLDMYARHGVCEYLVWRVNDRTIDWYVLRGGSYELLVPDAAGVLRSETFPGLWLDAAALLRLDLPAVLRTLQQGLGELAHAAFVARLRATPARP